MTAYNNNTRTLRTDMAIDKMAEKLENYLAGQGMEAQCFEDDDKWVVQARKNGGWRMALGMTRSTTVVLNPVEDGKIRAEVGDANWADKAAVGTISLFILWPLAVTATYGAIKQNGLQRDIFKFLSSIA